MSRLKSLYTFKYEKSILHPLWSPVVTYCTSPHHSSRQDTKFLGVSWPPLGSEPVHVLDRAYRLLLLRIPRVSLGNSTSEVLDIYN